MKGRIMKSKFSALGLALAEAVSIYTVCLFLVPSNTFAATEDQVDFCEFNKAVTDWQRNIAEARTLKACSFQVSDGPSGLSISVESGDVRSEAVVPRAAKISLAQSSPDSTMEIY